MNTYVNRQSKDPFVSFMRGFIEYKFKSLQEKSENVKVFIRIHYSGDFYSNEYFNRWVEIIDCFSGPEYNTSPDVLKVFEELKNSNGNRLTKYTVYREDNIPKKCLLPDGRKCVECLQCYTNKNTYVVTEQKEIILLTIYTKSKQENIVPSRIEEILKKL